MLLVVYSFYMFCVFFFKQKTAYEMRIRDWSSYVCSSDLLEPQHKIGPAASRMPEQGLEAERVEDHARIARENGEKIIANPSIALDGITRGQATFTTRDLAMFVHRHSDGKDQFDQAMSAEIGREPCRERVSQ